MDERPDFRHFRDEPQPHSGLGIVSFLLAVGSGLLVFLLITVAVLMELDDPGILDDESPLVVLFGLGLLTSLVLGVVGLGLGIAGACQRARKTVFAVLGIVFNLLVVVGLSLLIIIGMLSADLFL